MTDNESENKDGNKRGQTSKEGLASSSFAGGGVVVGAKLTAETLVPYAMATYGTAAGGAAATLQTFAASVSLPVVGVASAVGGVTRDIERIAPRTFKKPCRREETIVSKNTHPVNHQNPPHPKYLPSPSSYFPSIAARHSAHELIGPAHSTQYE